MVESVVDPVFWRELFMESCAGETGAWETVTLLTTRPHLQLAARLSQPAAATVYELETDALQKREECGFWE